MHHLKQGEDYVCKATLAWLLALTAVHRMCSEPAMSSIRPDTWAWKQSYPILQMVRLRDKELRTKMFSSAILGVPDLSAQNPRNLKFMATFGLLAGDLSTDTQVRW